MSQEVLFESEARDHSKSQWFTPPKVAQMMVDMGFDGYMGFDTPESVLEPSCGNGALIMCLPGVCDITAVDIGVGPRASPG